MRYLELFVQSAICVNVHTRSRYDSNEGKQSRGLNTSGTMLPLNMGTPFTNAVHLSLSEFTSGQNPRTLAII